MSSLPRFIGMSFDRSTAMRLAFRFSNLASSGSSLLLELLVSLSL